MGLLKIAIPLQTKILFALFIVFVGLNPTKGMSAQNNCRMIAESDAEFGQLAQDVRRYIPEAAGMVICEGAGQAASMVSAYVITKIVVLHDTKTYRLDIPYLYRDRFPASSAMQEHLYDGGNGQKIQFICFIFDQCDDFFDAGFAIVDEEIESSHYPELVDIWLRADIEEQVLSYHGPIREDVDLMKNFVKSGGVFLPTMLSLDNYDGHLKNIYIWVYASGGSDVPRDWSVDFEVSQDEMTMTGVSVVGVD